MLEIWSSISFRAAAYWRSGLSFTFSSIMQKTHTPFTFSSYHTRAHAELTLGWPVQSRGLHLPLLTAELVVSLHWWECQQLPIRSARSRVMDCVIPGCWCCSRSEVEFIPRLAYFRHAPFLASFFVSVDYCLFFLFSPLDSSGVSDTIIKTSPTATEYKWRL